MSEFRQNLATKEWVIIAPDRGKRPTDFHAEVERNGDVPEYRADCPFCPGNEEHTSEELLRLESANEWKIRVVENKFSALHPDHSVTR